MQLEFHQLDRRWEHLRGRRPERHLRLLASLAATGQQTPILVVAVTQQPDRYLVIDGYQRIAALEQLGRDTVESVVWVLREGEALVLGRSLAMRERATALEEGWLLAAGPRYASSVSGFCGHALCVSQRPGLGVPHEPPRSLSRMHQSPEKQRRSVALPPVSNVVCPLDWFVLYLRPRPAAVSLPDRRAGPS
jgi:hypothetical protein